ncbi:MAG: O-antigen ligase family protein, partial [Calditrichaeota bacterium]|nr:O-antigen ligase family protein [Calditrichota bacterium]
MDFPLKNISYILLGIILVLPQLDTFGIDIGITTIYYEEIVYALLIFVFLLYVIKNKKVVVDQSVILALFILILSILPGLYIGISKNGILRALQDFRPMLYYTSIIPFVFLLKDIDKKRFFNIILVLIWIHFIILFSVYLLREKHFLADVYALSINRGERFVGEKNEIILALIFSYYLSFLLYRYHNKINIVKFLLILIPVSATIYMTQTRAVFIALVVSIIISILMLFRFKLIRFSYIMRLLFLILPFILIYLIRAHFIEIDYNKNIISRFTTSKSLLQDSSVIARFYSSYEAYNLIRTSPILGVGYGQEIIIVPEWLA